MSRERVADFASELPARLREDVVGYARSVEAALPDIFRDGGVTETPALRDQLVLIAGVKKLYAICSSAFWILDRSLSDLEDADVSPDQIGEHLRGPGVATVASTAEYSHDD